MRKTKFIISCLAALTLLSTTAPCIANANEQESAVVSEVSAAAINPGGTADPQSDIIEWIYDERPDGSLYKRLFNYSTGTWIGKWIKIRDAYK